VFPIKAAELIARGVPHGPAVGIALRAAEQAWLAADFPSDQTALAAITAAATAIAKQQIAKQQ
jgi:poly(A) polymerase